MLDPVLVPRSWGPRWYETIVEYMDVRHRGKWRFLNKAKDGAIFGSQGEYLEIVPPERLVQTFSFDGAPGMGTITYTFTEREGRTLLREVSLFSTKEEPRQCCSQAWKTALARRTSVWPS